MELELKRGGRTARDERGLEYIWGGDPAYWPGRNPLLFPIVGTLKEGKIRFDGREYAMERHGFARRREFTPAARGEDWVRLELRESAETLALYPYPFRLAVERGFGIELDVQLSKDKVPVVFHDDSLLRVCGVQYPLVVRVVVLGAHLHHVPRRGEERHRHVGEHALRVAS